MNKFCTSCGCENQEEANFCKECGENLSTDSSSTQDNTAKETIVFAKTSGKAIASLILSILWLYGIGSIMAIILGHMARKDVKNSNGKLTGDGIALAGLIIGYTLLAIITFGLLAAVILPKLVGN